MTKCAATRRKDEMKIERHAKIIELINEYAIETQEELARKRNTDEGAGQPL